MKSLEVKLSLAPSLVIDVGTLVEQERQIFFEYEKSFLELGLELSPYKLPVRRGLIAHKELSFGPLPGLFDDSLPDGWGLIRKKKPI